MITFTLNNQEKTFSGDENLSLLHYLREIENITSLKDGCSGQAFCGACMVEVNQKPILSCVTPLKKIAGSKIYTIEGFDAHIAETIARAFVRIGAVQCGFCSPGLLVRTKVLLDKNLDPSREKIIKALKGNYCRCTGYLKIVEAIQSAAQCLRENHEISIPVKAGLGESLPKYQAVESVLGKRKFVNDLKFEGMLYGALKFSDHPRAKVLNIDTGMAEQLAGVQRIFTAKDIPGERYNGLIVKDWPVMVAEGEITRYIGDVLVGVAAASEKIARQAVLLIQVEYEVLEPVCDMLVAEESPIKIHPKGNLLETCELKRGENVDRVFERSAYTTEGTFETQRIEHAFLETEAAIALPWQEDGIELYVQSQGVYEDQNQIARILGLPKERIIVNLVPTGGGFGGKEDVTVQPHAALFCYYLRQPIRVKLNRDESVRMHPKRHPIRMAYKVGCDESGRLTALKARIIGDTGAYASVGMKVLERVAGHATGAYYIPNVDIIAKTVYTNNIPSGAMRGFGVPQATFAIESCIDDLCEKAEFDRWQFRFQNALKEGSRTATGQILEDGVGVRETLLAVKDEFYEAKYAGISCGIKNCGIGNAMPDYCEVKIEISAEDRVIIHHGWTEMGQGIFTVAQQFLYEETGIEPSIVVVKTSTESGARAGMTTSSRASSLLGNAIINAAKVLKKDLETKTLKDLIGKTYPGSWICDWTTKPGEPGKVITHYSYSYATHLVTLDDDGKMDTVYAAHDAGKVINPALFEGQIHGSVHMGVGYALSEELPLKEGRLETTKLRKMGLLKIDEMPNVVVKPVEVKDPLGPHGVKGIGEIGMVPTAAAVANALYQYDKVRRYRLPLQDRGVKCG